MGTILTDSKVEREAMVERQLKSRGITEPHILNAFLEVPREAFVSPGYSHLAYGDHPLPIDAGQTISQPYIVALMIEAAGIKAGDKVLEVGAGSGYAAAVIGRISAQVVAIERQHDLVETARKRLERLGYGNVTIVEGDGTMGCAEEAPFNAILAAASGSHVPQPWIDQLEEGGCIVMPIGQPGWVQELIKVTKGPGGRLVRENLGGVRFVPLVGEEGWKDD